MPYDPRDDIAPPREPKPANTVEIRKRLNFIPSVSIKGWKPSRETQRDITRALTGSDA